MVESLSRRSLIAGVGAAGLTAGVAAPAAAATSPPSTRAPQGREVIIEAGWALIEQPGGPVLKRDVSIHVVRDRIVAVREGRIRGGARRVRLNDQLVLPGFISGHTHVAGRSCTRGTFEGTRSYVRPLELAEQLDDKDMDALTAYNLAELIRSGCTTQVEQSLSLRQARSYVRVAGPWGVRGYPAGMVPGVPRLF